MNRTIRQRTLLITLTSGLIFASSFISPHLANAQGNAKMSPEQRARDNLKKLKETTSLLWINSTLRAFSYLKKDDVLSTLLKIYQKPPTTPKDHIRFLTMTIIRQKYDKKNWLKSGYYRRDKPSDPDLERLREFLKKDITQDPQGWVAC
ncbi:MAG: hypothetical protein P1V97_16000, partial [Planctomycetota bacterium]|nr:hypothetical protein [Planctomycetota bacterium]